MKYLIMTIMLIFSINSYGDTLGSKALTDSALRDIQKGIAELSMETDRSSAKIYAEALSKRIDREAYLVARQESEMMGLLISLQDEIKKQKEIIENYASLVSILENRIKELENE